MLTLILQESLFQFSGKYYLQTQGTVSMKMAANIYKAKIENKMLR